MASSLRLEGASMPLHGLCELNARWIQLGRGWRSPSLEVVRVVAKAIGATTAEPVEDVE